ncbi:MAG: hypothetical protein IPH44_05210 [Myxococcales bacterium]|nr:hypothetical protein [Myxococcales bacterium]MBK7193642.1 hypothetical protein [Myxococcales bacterium]MBP6847874.1 hypothetical protein [Kofleriaceae bacterium]
MRALQHVLVITVVAVGCGGGGGDAPLADAPLADAPLADAPLADAPLADAPLPDAPGSLVDASLVDALSPIDATFDAGNWIDPLDHAFGADGVVTTPDGLPSRVAIDALGRIVIVGVRHGPTPDQFGPGYVERRLATGALDPSFDGDGAAAAPPHPTSLAVLTDGRIVIGGGEVYGDATELAHVLDASGARVATIPGGRQAFVAIAAMPDGGFVAAVEQGVMLAQLVTVRRYRADLSTAWVSGQVAVVSSAGPVTLAAVTTGGADRVLLTAEGALVSLAAATGAPDGAYAVPAGSWQSPFSGVPLRQVGAQVAMIDRVTDAARVRPVAPAGGYGAAVLAPSCLALESYYPSGAAVDGAGRLVLAPSGGQQDQTVAVVRLAPALDQLDPAWGCGRWFTLPPLCPPGEPCLGTGTDDFAIAADLAIAPGNAPVVVGYQRRFHGVSRGFVAKLVP